MIGALYGLARKEKAESDATIESVSFNWHLQATCFKIMKVNIDSVSKVLMLPDLNLTLRMLILLFNYIFYGSLD